MTALTILIVEDEAGLRTIYQRILEDSGCEIVLVKDGGEAIDFLSHHSPDLLFLDMLLPVMSGEDVLNYVLQAQPRLAHMHVVIASSAKDYERDLDIMPSAEFLLKPIRPAQIRDIAARLVAVRQA